MSTRPSCALAVRLGRGGSAALDRSPRLCGAGRRAARGGDGELRVRQRPFLRRVAIRRSGSPSSVRRPSPDAAATRLRPARRRTGPSRSVATAGRDRLRAALAGGQQAPCQGPRHTADRASRPRPRVFAGGGTAGRRCGAESGDPRRHRVGGRRALHPVADVGSRSSSRSAFGVIFAPGRAARPPRRPARASERIRAQNAPRSPRTCTTRCCRRSRSIQRRVGRPARGRRPRAPPGARAARLAVRRGPGDRPRRWLAAARGRAARSRRPTASPSTSSPSATRRSTASAEALVAAAREAMVNAAKLAGAAAGRRLRRGRRRARCRSSSATAVRASTRRRPATGAACASRSSGAWPPRRARDPSHTAPAGAPRSSSARLERRDVTPAVASSSSTTTSCSAPACARRSTSSSRSSARPATSSDARAADHPRPRRPTSCCSTCTCPAAAA